MIDFQALWDAIARVKNISPLVHNITNYVTANPCANITLACGASPVMADEIMEVEDIQSISKGLNINIGTINSNRIESILRAGETAKRLGHPIVFDPVGVGASKFRFEVAMNILKKIKPDVIKGNLSEIRSIWEKKHHSKGVDVSEEDKKHLSLSSAEFMTRELAKELDAVVITTGEVDIISDGRSIVRVFNGHSMMEKITGSGCQLSSVVAAFISANPDCIFEASVSAVITMGISGELAYENLHENQSCGSYGIKLIDAMSEIDEAIFKERGRYEIV